MTVGALVEACHLTSPTASDWSAHLPCDWSRDWPRVGHVTRDLCQSKTLFGLILIQVCSSFELSLKIITCALSNRQSTNHLFTTDLDCSRSRETTHQ